MDDISRLLQEAKPLYFARKRRNIVRRFLRRRSVRRNIYHGIRNKGCNEIFQGIGNAENRRGRAAAEFFSQKGIVPSYIVKSKEIFFHRAS